MIDDRWRRTTERHSYRGGHRIASHRRGIGIEIQYVPS